ncbi:hypothetical protein [Arthrobacter luteolus]|uniref:hypothetical protein n=1 Tax=Arthrobacter luteolus TaxID=98672 RepID=UPI000A77E77A|nr:hypothetical protein [Arthrobacter luteolus]
MSTRPRTPEHFPRMKHRAAKRQAVYVDIPLDLSGFIAAARAAARALAKMTNLPTPSPTEAAPNRAASLIPGEKP